MKAVSLDQQPEPYASAHDKQDPISRFLSILKGDLPGIPLVFEPGENCQSFFFSHHYVEHELLKSFPQKSRMDGVVTSSGL